MTTPDDNHEDLLHQQEEADRKHRESMEGSGVVLLAGLIPFTLVMIVLSAIFGDWVYKLMPVWLIGLFLGFIATGWRTAFHLSCAERTASTASSLANRNAN